ncbi:MAG: lipopolysaccharide assembly protein LapA domain-containing protein [Gammaproteobacteria bacterium]|nr:lipopolysaccharide assembly protein LapA domain-containing protein [Gammaproteobacteria bacterium]
MFPASEPVRIWTLWSNRLLKKIGIGILVILVFAIMLVFTSSNPGFVDLDLFFKTVRPSIPLAFSVTFVLGWAFGLLCTVVFILRLANERRRLRRQLRHAESEITSLRNLPIADAD